MIDTFLKTKRASALDAVRGLAIIGMVLSGTVAYTLPGWMYHAQVGPRSNFQFDPSFYGITWVDLVFPFFLFAMGAAFPLAMRRKIDGGISFGSLLRPILKRGMLLAIFAISIYCCTPYRLTGGESKYLLALLAFACWFCSFAKIPQISSNINNRLNWIGYIALFLLIGFNLYNCPEAFPSGFKFSNNDVIILVLANMAVFGSIIWILTASNITARLGVLAFLLAFRLTSGMDSSWNQQLFNFNPLQWLPESWTAILYTPGGWLYRMDFLKYLFIIIPGSIVGDLLVTWLNDKQSEQNQPRQNGKMALLLVLSFAFIVVNLYGWYTRSLDFIAVANLLMCASGYWLLNKPATSLSRFYRSIYNWGVFWLLLGTAFEAFEGGVRKDNATMSYFFITTGLAVMALLFFSVVIDYFGNKRIFRYIIESGQNPMVAYVAGTFVVLPLLIFSQLMPFINQLHEVTPWFGLFKGLIITSGTVAITVFTVRKKWFWKT